MRLTPEDQRKRELVASIVGATVQAQTLTQAQQDAIADPVTQQSTKHEILAWLALFVPLGYPAGSMSMSKPDLLVLVWDVLSDLT